MRPRPHQPGLNRSDPTYSSAADRVMWLGHGRTLVVSRGSRLSMSIGQVAPRGSQRGLRAAGGGPRGFRREFCTSVKGMACRECWCLAPRPDSRSLRYIDGRRSSVWAQLNCMFEGSSTLDPWPRGSPRSLVRYYRIFDGGELAVRVQPCKHGLSFPVNGLRCAEFGILLL